MMQWRLTVVAVLLVLILCVLAEPPTTVTAETFTLIGRVDGGGPSGTLLAPGPLLTLVSDDSGAPTRYVVDLAWVRDRLPSLDQDDEVSVEIADSA